MVKIIKAPVGFKLITYRCVDKTLTQCALLLGNKFGKEKYCRIILDLLIIVYLDRNYATIHVWWCSIPP